MIDDHDIVRDISISMASTIPYVGGPISFLLDKILPSSFQERYENYINELGKEIKRLHIAVDAKLYHSEAFLSLFQKTLEYAVCEYEKEKLTSYRNILLNAIVQNDQFDRAIFFAKLTSVFSTDQIRYLSVCEKKHTSILDMKKLHPYTDEFYIICSITELTRYRLINGSTLTNLGKQYLEYLADPSKVNEKQ